MPEEYLPVDGDPFAASAVSLQPVQGDPFTAGSVTPESQGQAERFTNRFADIAGRFGQSAIAPFMAPGDYMQGKISADEAQRQAFNLATMTMGGGLAGVERGAGEAVLGSGPMLRVARKMPDGSIKVGNPGQLHSDLIGDHPLVGPDQPETTMGYVAPNGNYLTRQEALDYANKNEPARAAYSSQHPEYGLEASTYLEPVTGDPFASGASALPSFQPITAYHGSPHDFDAFDTSKIGTGEGAQAYGHGLYFAENEGTARDYQNRLAPSQTWYHGDRPLSGAENDAAADIVGGTAATRAKAQRAFPDLDPSNLTWAPGKGNMYQVQINADPNHFLDWDKLLSEQHPVVQSAVSNLVKGNSELESAIPQVTGENIINRILPMTGVGRGGADIDHEVISQTLKQAGVPGIKYLDAGSRSIIQPPRQTELLDGSPGWEVDSPKGTRTFTSKSDADEFYQQMGPHSPTTSNYVVFDHNIIDILKKYGIGGLGIGTAAALKHFQTQPVQGDPYASETSVY